MDIRHHPLLHAPAFHLPARFHDVVTGVWRLADPKITIASLVPFAAGLALAHAQGAAIDWRVAMTAYVAIFFVEVGKNAVNDLYDFRSGADSGVREDERSPFSGGKRTIVDRLLTEDDLGVIASIAFALAAIVGTEVALWAHPALLALGGAAALLSIAYVMPPLKLSYRGLGELAVGAIYGPGIFLGAMLLMNAQITGEAALSAVAFGVLISVVLLVNEVPDERADRAAGKNTLVVRLGRETVEQLLPFLFILAIGLPALGAAYGVVPFRDALFLAAVPTATYACWSIVREHGRPPVHTQIATLLTYAIAGIAFVATVLLVP